MWWINNSGVNSLKGEPQYVHDDGTQLRNYIEAVNYVNVYGGEYTEWVDGDGNPADPDNQIILEDAMILNCICSIAKAREDFFAALPSLNSKEQYRMSNILERSPFYKNGLIEMEHKVSDSFTRKINRQGVRTSGRYGGTGYR